MHENIPSEEHPHEIIGVTTYGNSNEPVDCVVLCQHGDSGVTFMANEKLRRVIPANNETLEDYLRLEQDVATPELAHEIAQQIFLQSNGEYTSKVVEARFPRGVADPNRITRRALRNVAHWKAHPEVAAKIRMIHGQIIRATHEELEDLHHTDGYVVDIHSMAPYSIHVPHVSSDAVSVETPETLKKYINGYLDPRYRTKKRAVDLVTTIPGLAPIADKTLLREIEESLTESGIAYAYDDPYPTALHIMTTEYLNHYKGMSLDFPKSYLTHGSLTQSTYDLCNLMPCMQKVRKMAFPVAAAIIKTLQRSRESTLH